MVAEVAAQRCVRLLRREGDVAPGFDERFLRQAAQIVHRRFQAEITARLGAEVHRQGGPDGGVDAFVCGKPGMDAGLER